MTYQQQERKKTLMAHVKVSDMEEVQRWLRSVMLDEHLSNLIQDVATDLYQWTKK